MRTEVGKLLFQSQVKVVEVRRVSGPHPRCDLIRIWGAGDSIFKQLRQEIKTQCMSG